MRSKLGITFFEDQIVRYYLTGDGGRFFGRIAETFELVIFTNLPLAKFIKESLGQLGYGDIQVTIFEPIADKGVARLAGFFLHWLLPSGTMLVKLKRKSWFLSFFASFVYNSLNRFVTLRTLARFLYQESFSKSILKSHFDNEPMKLDALFVTSLTNNYEDIRIATYYRRFKKTTVIGTIRSWDNLTSHGCLRFIPDIFLSHSEFTTQCFIEIQNLDQSLIYQWRVPAYERLVNYLYNGKSSSSRKRQHFTYASMGLATNPDDKNVIEWLINTWKTMPDHFELTILQHPKFAIDVTESRNVKVRRFDYLDSRLEEYYEFLSSQDIVVCGGTSVVLDCLFTKTPMVLVNFEIVRQPYWISALRYFDSIDHTKDLFSRFNFTIANNPTQLIELLISKQVKQIELEDYTYFLGNTGVDAAGSLINILTNIPRNQ